MSKHVAANITKQQWSLWLSNTTGWNTLEILLLVKYVWESDHNVHQARERVQFYTKGCKCVDMLGSTTLVGPGMSKSTQRYSSYTCSYLHHTMYSLHAYSHNYSQGKKYVDTQSKLYWTCTSV